MFSGPPAPGIITIDNGWYVQTIATIVTIDLL